MGTNTGLTKDKNVMIVDRIRLAAPLVAASMLFPQAASAQEPSYATHGETIHGTIASVQNVNHLFVEDDRGYTDDVTLRAGATVYSSGLRLEPGTRVTIVGSAAGPTFLATRISTQGRSYQSADIATVAVPEPVPIPYPVYYPSYYPASYPYGYGYPFSYGISVGFGFGGYRGYGGYHGGYGGFHGGGYGGGFHGGFAGGGRGRR
jgi:hypothetical protein